MKKIGETVTITSTFLFTAFEKSDVEKSVGNLSSSEVGTFQKNPLK